jgi:WD40 repeat protein
MNRRPTIRRAVRVGLVVGVLLGLGATTVFFVPRAAGVAAGDPLRFFAWDRASLPVKQTFKHAGYVSVVAISPNNRYLAAGGVLERSISVWDLATGRLVHRLSNEQGSISALAWSPDSTRLASGRDFIRIVEGHIAVDVWDISTGHRLLSMTDAFVATRVSMGVRKLAFSPDGTRIAAALSGLALYDATTGALVRSAKDHPAHGGVVAFSPDGRYLATTGRPRQSPIELLDPRTGAPLRNLVADLGMQRLVEFSPDSRAIASAALDERAIALWDVEQGGLLPEPLRGHSGFLRALVFSGDGRWLASLGDGDGLKVWAWRERQLVASVAVGKRAGPVAVFSADGRWLVSSDDTVVQLRDFRGALPALLKQLEQRSK